MIWVSAFSTGLLGEMIRYFTFRPEQNINQTNFEACPTVNRKT
jgi:hypothetical protein